MNKNTKVKQQRAVKSPAKCLGEIRYGVGGEKLVPPKDPNMQYQYCVRCGDWHLRPKV